MRKRSFYKIGICLIKGICLLLLAGCNGSDNPGISASAQTKVTPTTTLESVEQAILPTEPPFQSIETPTLSPEYIQFMQTVAAVMDTMPTYTPYPHVPALDDRVQSEQRGELMNAAVKTVIAMPGWVPLITPEPTTTPNLTPFPGQPTYQAGSGFIDENSWCGIDKRIGARNKWREHIGTRIVGVCAGTTYFRPYFGIILVEDYDTATNKRLSGPDIYRVPADVLWVEVTGAVGEQVTLKADTGDYFYFDVPTRQWVNP